MPEPALNLTTPPDAARRLTDRVRAARLRLGWKQSTLAERAGISLGTVKRYETRGNTSVENLLRMAHALGELDAFGELFREPPARTMAELEADSKMNRPQRGRR